jgi:hypothetical protein
MFDFNDQVETDFSQFFLGISFIVLMVDSIISVERLPPEIFAPP